MLNMFYLNGYGMYVYAAIFATVVPMSVYASWVYRRYLRMQKGIHD